MRSNRFITISDFPSYKNDSQSNSISVSVAVGKTWSPSSASSAIVGQANLTAGTQGAGIRCRCRSTTGFTGNWVVGTAVRFVASTRHVPSGTVYNQTYEACLVRTSPTQVTVYVSPYGIGGGPDTYEIRQAFTVEFVFSTFLSPFN